MGLCPKDGGGADQRREDQEHRKDACDRFLAAWESGAEPRIDMFLDAYTAGEPASEPTALLEMLIEIDLEQRWQRAHERSLLNSTYPQASSGVVTAGKVGNSLPRRPKLEDYLARYPQLGGAARLSVDLIVHEYCVRKESGDEPAHEEYTRRFPWLSDVLERILSGMDVELATRQTTPRMDAKRTQRGSWLEQCAECTVRTAAGRSIPCR